MSTEERSAHLLQFVQVALQLEQLRHAWAASVLELDIDSPDNFGRFTKLYDSLVVAPMVQNLRDREVQVGSGLRSVQLVSAGRTVCSRLLAVAHNCRREP